MAAQRRWAGGDGRQGKKRKGVELDFKNTALTNALKTQDLAAIAVMRELFGADSMPLPAAFPQRHPWRDHGC